MANKPTKVNARQSAFAKLIVDGRSNSAAYRAIYNPAAKDRSAAEQGCKIAAQPLVKAEIERLRSRSEARTLLSLNDRLGLLAEVARMPVKSAGDKQARARSIEVYSKISGDQAPDRHEVTGKDGAPVAISASVTGSVTATVTRMPVRERIRLLRERRVAEKAEREAAKV